MTISDVNPMILILLGFIVFGGLGKMIGAWRRSSPGRYDIRDEE